MLSDYYFAKMTKCEKEKVTGGITVFSTDPLTGKICANTSKTEEPIFSGTDYSIFRIKTSNYKDKYTDLLTNKVYETISEAGVVFEGRWYIDDRFPILKVSDYFEKHEIDKKDVKELKKILKSLDKIKKYEEKIKMEDVKTLGLKSMVKKIGGK